ncbi:hypothetical protein [Streptosporangium lutulentum]|uniref:Uncharacterized protein n=1 Tax=Streptosporangium lutulentum TaxID=1461250 RepID=A0ABT9QUQ2_9ACTN|nr:hypothetical protein [Streptosporangium lutulentum]MDP9850484.1 hypothetical protein [Streptosporangium lutulentum]
MNENPETDRPDSEHEIDFTNLTFDFLIQEESDTILYDEGDGKSVNNDLGRRIQTLLGELADISDPTTAASSSFPGTPVSRGRRSTGRKTGGYG